MKELIIPPAETVEHTSLLVELPAIHLAAELSLPQDAAGLVVFVHGSGSSRLSPRNQRVARRLNEHLLGCLLFDLLTRDENEKDQKTAEYRFDIGFLAQRLEQVIDWVAQQASLKPLPIGLFGASTGAAAALNVAVTRPHAVRAVVSRGGRPDLASQVLAEVEAPTLLIVGGDDPDVLGLNQDAMRHLCCVHSLSVIAGASHLFEEPGTLDEAAHQAAEWFVTHLTDRPV